MLKWLKQLQISFGAPFLWLISLIYFTQGFRSFVWTAVSYQLKDMLKLSPSVSQLVVTIAFFPWSVKPFYGILSDCVPIRGRKRIPYLLIATVLSLVPWLVLGLKASLRSSRVSLTIFLTIQNLGSAMADVVVDAMIAEAVRSERAEFAGDLQSLSWSAMAFGGICGSLLGGFTLKNLPIDIVFLLFSVLPTIQLLSCGLVEEAPLGSEALGGYESSNGHTRTSDDLVGLQKKMDVDFSNGGNALVETSKAGNSKRRKKSNKNNSVKARSTKSELLKQHRPLRSSLKLAIYSLYNAFRQPIILRPMAWFFLAHITVPNLSTIMFYYQTEVLQLEASFLGTARVISWFGIMLGTFIYNRYFKHMKLRSILMSAHVGLATLSLLDIILVSRSNVLFGISDKLMVLCGSALSDAINQLKLMPFLIISGQLCPPGIEGTLFALFMSINNLGSTISSFGGAGLASLLNISSDSFDNLISGIFIQVICTFIPIGFLFLIPKEATGLST